MNKEVIKLTSKVKLAAIIYVSSLLMMIMVNIFFPKIIPYEIFDFLEPKTYQWKDAFMSAWMLFAWGIIIASIAFFFNKNKFTKKNKASTFTDIFFMNAFLATTEETFFRWSFFSNIVFIASCVYMIFKSLIDFSVIASITTAINYITFQNIETIAYPHGPLIWISIIISNLAFSIMHMNQRLIGILSAWLVGLYLFYIALQFGLVLCIIIHFAYNMVYCGTQATLKKVLKKIMRIKY